MKMITISQAMEISNHNCRREFDRWVQMWNAAFPYKCIKRRRGKVDILCLQEALVYERVVTE